MNKSFNIPLHVVAAAVFNESGKVLITRRPDHVHQGGLWEFPGGKVEAGESASVALTRELHEEVGIDVQQTRPLIRTTHAYPDKEVLLDVWRVDGFSGEAHGKEGQPFKWVDPEQLANFSFPEANVPIIHAVQLPELYLITPDPGDDTQVFLNQFEKCLASGIRLVQLRAKSLSQKDYIKLAKQTKKLCIRFNAKLILNSDPELVFVVNADGVNLTGERLLALDKRPLADDKWVAASCHTEEDILQASKIGVDFGMLSPVQATASHPETIPIGWSKFQAVCEHAPFPVYALGGVKSEDLNKAFEYGAQGIAAIRALWD